MADLSKIKLNGETYNFKDAEIRESFVNSIGRSIPYGYCTTAAATVGKEVTVSPAPEELASGLTIAVKFQYANTGSNPTLDVNNFGAIAIKRYGTTAPGTSAASNWNANSIVLLTYDGTYWQIDSFNNTTYSGMTDAEYQAGTSTTNRLITPARLKAAIQLWAPEIPENVSAFTNDAGYLTSYTETDPVFAASAAAGITSTDITNWNNKLSSFTETDPTVPAWAKAANKPTYTASEVGAAASGHTHDTLQTTAGANNTEYNLIGTATTNTNTSAVSIYNPGSISFAKTTSLGRLTIGSSSLPGVLRLYSSTANATGYTDLVSGATSTNTRTITFPDKTGTVALTTDIPSVPSWALASSKPTYTAAEVGATTSSDVSSMIASAVSGITSFSTEVVQTLPASGVAGRIYFLAGESNTNDIYEEYIYVNNSWEKLGNFDASQIDLEDYLKKDDLASWAKAATKPSYTASEVGALASNTTYVSTFNGQSGAITYTAPVTSVNNQTGAVTITAASISASADTHVHGNITNGGDMTATAAIASGDRLVINDESASKLVSSTITFGSSTTQYLANNGTWQNVPTTSVTQTLTSGTAIGSVNSTTLYAPTPYDDTALAARVTALEEIPWVTYHTGNSIPSNSFGNNGDLYLEIG